MRHLLEFDGEKYHGLYVTPIILDKRNLRFFDWYDESIQETIKDLCHLINTKYKTDILVKLIPDIQPGLITKESADIKTIAKDIHNFLISKGLENRVVFGSGAVEEFDKNINFCYGELLIKIGRKTDSLSGKSGLFEATKIISKRK